MQSFQVRSKPVGENSFLHAGLLPAGVTVRPGCSICQGPLMLVAYIAPALGNPAQRIYRCDACDHLEWAERIKP
jgi:hypothetical protein